MTYAATYNRIRHLPDIRYDITSRVTTVGNALPAVFLSRDRHTAGFTGRYPGPEGPDTRYTGVSGTKRSWLCYHRDIYHNCIHRQISMVNIKRGLNNEVLLKMSLVYLRTAVRAAGFLNKLHSREIC